MKRNLFKYILLMSISMIIHNSCENPDEFLDIKPHAGVVTGSYYSNMEEADQAITAAYSMFNTVAQWDRNLLVVLGNMTSDDVETGGDHVNEVPELENFNRMIYSPTSNVTFEVYSNAFRGIYLCNLAIENLPGVPETDEEANLDLLEKRIAEARFVRAVNYFYLMKIFGGVPLVDRVVRPSEYNMGRSSIRSIIDFIETDLKHCIDILPERSGWGAGSIGRATKGAAKAFLSRLYLYESSYAMNYPNMERFEGLNERWDEALDYAEQVIESGEYNLVGIDGETYNTWRGPETDGYRYIFTTDGDNSAEAVFEIQCVQEGLGWANARGSSLAQWTSARYYLSEGGGSESTSYWGLNWPTQDLADDFEDGDPRFHTSFSTGGDSIQITGGVWVPVDSSTSATGYFTAKFEASSEEFIDISNAWHSSPLNIKLMRFAEVYLNAAEAAFRMDETGKALDYVNKVRERARNCGNTGAPAELTSITFDDIIKERRVELALEGHRFFDLVRWGEDIAGDQLNRFAVDGYDVIWNFPKHMFFPLPQQEIDVTRGGLEQYDGW